MSQTQDESNEIEINYELPETYPFIVDTAITQRIVDEFPPLDDLFNNYNENTLESQILDLIPPLPNQVVDRLKETWSDIMTSADAEAQLNWALETLRFEEIAKSDLSKIVSLRETSLNTLNTNYPFPATPPYNYISKTSTPPSPYTPKTNSSSGSFHSADASPLLNQCLANLYPNVPPEMADNAREIIAFLASQEHPRALYYLGVWIECGTQPFLLSIIFNKRNEFPFKFTPNTDPYELYDRALQGGYLRACYRLAYRVERQALQTLHKQQKKKFKSTSSPPTRFNQRHTHYFSNTLEIPSLSYAFDLYNRGAQGNDAWCSYRLAFAHFFGQLGLPISRSQGMYYLSISAAHADVECPQGAYLYSLALAGEVPHLTGDLNSISMQNQLYSSLNLISNPNVTVSPSPGELGLVARSFLSAAATLGSPAACLRLAQAFANASPSLACEFSPQIAMRYYLLASCLGGHNGTRPCGAGGGTPTAPATADLELSKWWLAGYEPPTSNGCYNSTDDLYDVGGVQANEDLAVFFAARVALLGEDKHLLPQAFFAIGYFYEVGIGVEQDSIKAQQWYKWSIAQASKLKPNNNKRYTIANFGKTDDDDSDTILTAAEDAARQSELRLKELALKRSFSRKEHEANVARTISVRHAAAAERGKKASLRRKNLTEDNATDVSNNSAESPTQSPFSFAETNDDPNRGRKLSRSFDSHLFDTSDEKLVDSNESSNNNTNNTNNNNNNNNNNNSKTSTVGRLEIPHLDKPFKLLENETSIKDALNSIKLNDSEPLILPENFFAGNDKTNRKSSLPINHEANPDAFIRRDSAPPSISSNNLEDNRKSILSARDKVSSTDALRKLPLDSRGYKSSTALSSSLSNTQSFPSSQPRNYSSSPSRKPVSQSEANDNINILNAWTDSINLNDIKKPFSAPSIRSTSSMPVNTSGLPAEPKVNRCSSDILIARGKEGNLKSNGNDLTKNANKQTKESPNFTNSDISEENSLIKDMPLLPPPPINSETEIRGKGREDKKKRNSEIVRLNSSYSQGRNGSISSSSASVNNGGLNRRSRALSPIKNELQKGIYNNSELNRLSRMRVPDNETMSISSKPSIATEDNNSIDLLETRSLGDGRLKARRSQYQENYKHPLATREQRAITSTTSLKTPLRIELRDEGVQSVDKRKTVSGSSMIETKVEAKAEAKIERVPLTFDDMNIPIAKEEEKCIIM